MVMVIDKPPIVGGDLPPLPPFLKKRGGPERRTMIMPDLTRITDQELICDTENNWKTVIYHRMMRVVGESFLDPAASVELAHSSTRCYRQWLETYNYPSGIPPHIQFGGAIESIRDGDPTFQKRWEAWAREIFF